jgi:membrane associated rhomboid family serine protease
MNYQEYRPSRFSILPEAVKNILIINGIFYLATVVLANRGIDLGNLLGLHYWESSDFRPWQVITYMFMHGSFSHLFFNMFAVWMFGAAVENIWGAKRFLTYYILTGLGAAVCHYAIFYYELRPAVAFIDDFLKTPDLTKLDYFMNADFSGIYNSSELSTHIRQLKEIWAVDPDAALEYSRRFMIQFHEDLINAPVVVGASGSVFGLLLAYGMIFPDSIIYIYFALPIKAKYFVILYGVLELFSGIAKVPGDNIAHFAHLGGLITGFILIHYWRRPRGNMYRF